MVANGRGKSYKSPHSKKPPKKKEKENSQPFPPGGLQKMLGQTSSKN